MPAQTPDNWRDYLPEAWQAMPLKTRAQSLCDFDPSLYTPAERISARAKRLAGQPIDTLPRGFVDDTHGGLQVRYAAKRMAKLAHERAELLAAEPRRPAPPIEPRSYAERLGIDPRANENTVHGLRFGMVRRDTPRKHWVLMCHDTGIEIYVSGETRPQKWESFAWLNHGSSPDDFRRAHGK